MVGLDEKRARQSLTGAVAVDFSEDPVVTEKVGKKTGERGGEVSLEKFCSEGHCAIQ